MEKQIVLIVDDEDPIRELLSLYFTQAGFAVAEAADGAQALLKLQQVNPSILILDIMMPVLDGLEVCQQIRKISAVPIIMLTSRTEDDDRILGLDMGADDYISKPFNPKEVVARVKAVLRRSSQPDQPPSISKIDLPNLTIDLAARTVTAFNEPIALANKEFELLGELAAHPGQVYSREQLLETIWGYTYCGDTRTVDTHVKRIRKKLGSTPATPWDIKTVWGIGYKFEVKA